MPLLGLLPGPRSCKSGNDGNQQYAQGWPGMTSTTYERSMMWQACGAISAHDGDYCSYSFAEREDRLFTNRSNRPGDDMTDVLRTDNAYAWHAWRTHMTNHGGFVNQLPLQCFLVSM